MGHEGHDWIGVPTRDRPEHLARALDQIVMAFREHPPDLLISDDSSLENQERNLQGLTRASKALGCRAYLLDKATKRDFAARVAQLAGVDKPLVHFAAVGPNALAFGAAQNCLQLFTKGGRVLLQDDDVILRPARRRCSSDLPAPQVGDAEPE